MNKKMSCARIFALVFLAQAVMLGAANAQAGESKADEINKAAGAVDLKDSEAASAFKAKYATNVDALAGYGKIPWGVSPQAVMLLADFPVAQFNYNDDCFAEGGWRQSTEKMKGIPLAPPRTTTVYTGATGLDANGSGDEKTCFFYFLDGKLYGLDVSYTIRNAWSVEKLKATGQYFEHPTWKGSNWALIQDTLTQKAGKPKELPYEDGGKKFKVSEWENGVGFARMFMEVVENPDKDAGETGKYKLVGTSYCSKELKPQVEAKSKKVVEEAIGQAKKATQEQRQKMLDNVL